MDPVHSLFSVLIWEFYVSLTKLGNVLNKFWTLSFLVQIPQEIWIYCAEELKETTQEVDWRGINHSTHFQSDKTCPIALQIWCLKGFAVPVHVGNIGVVENVSI